MFTKLLLPIPVFPIITNTLAVLIIFLDFLIGICLGSLTCILSKAIKKINED